MGTQKTRNLTVETLNVTGTLTVNGQPFDSTPVPEAVISTAVPPLAPLPLPERLTMVALAQAHNDLVDTLITAGLLLPHPGLPGGAE